MYKLIGDNDLNNILATIGNNRGIEVTKEFLDSIESFDGNTTKLNNMDKAVEMFDKHNNKNSVLKVPVDSDIDGFTSASMLIKYIRDNFPEVKVEYIFHDGKRHGLTPHMMKEIKSSHTDLVIVTDGGSNDLKAHKELKELGIDCLVIDHHDVSGEVTKDAVIVSNDPKVTPNANKELSGAGVTYLFLKALDEKYGLNDADDYLLLVATGIIGDAMTITNPETRYYVYKGLSKLNNPLIRQLVYTNAYHRLRDATFKTIGWNVANYVNATIRQGSHEEQEIILRAMLHEEEEELRTYTYRGQKKEKLETLEMKAVRLATNLRATQNRRKKKVVKSVLEDVDKFYDKDNPFMIIALDELEGGYSGFVAGDIAQYYKMPTLMLSWNEYRQKYTGSLRGYEPFMENTKDFLEETGLFDLIQGHQNACGIAITKENLELLPQAIKDSLPKDLKQSKLEVDFEIKQYQLNGALAYELDKLEKFFVKGFEEPLFAIKDVQVNTSEIKYGVPLRIPINDVEAVIFKGDKDLEEYELENKTLVCDIVGTLGVNRFLGKETPQLVIEAIKVKDEYEELLF